jgi:hypothetical protein
MDIHYTVNAVILVLKGNTILNSPQVIPDMLFACGAKARKNAFCHSLATIGKRSPAPYVTLSEAKGLRDSEFILSETKELEFLHFVQDSLRSLRMTAK